MDISRRGLDFIKRKEGYFSRAYLCPAGVWTIGWGSIRWDAHTPVKPGDTCTEEQAERLLLKEVQRVEDAIDRAVKVQMSQGMFDALVSWGYNVGIGWITGKGHPQATLIKKLNRGEYDAVPSELLKFCRTTGGKRLEGLYLRRQEEVRELWMGNYGAEESAPSLIHDTDPSSDPMPRSVGPARPSAAKVARESTTVKAAGVGIVGTIVQGWNWLFSVAKEAGVDAVASQQALTPYEALFAALKANMGLVAAAVVGGSLVVVILRRIQRERA